MARWPLRCFGRLLVEGIPVKGSAHGLEAAGPWGPAPGSAWRHQGPAGFLGLVKPGHEFIEHGDFNNLWMTRDSFKQGEICGDQH